MRPANVWHADPVSSSGQFPADGGVAPPRTCATATDGPPVPPDARAVLTPESAGLIAEAGRKSGLVWVRAGEAPGRDWPVWHLWHDDAVYVLTGGTEQQVPGLAEAGSATVTMRSKDNGGRLVAWPARVRHVERSSQEWATLVPLLQAKRLNAPDGERAPDRWARECTLLRLEPGGPVLSDATSPDSDSHASEPAPTPATTRVRIPFNLHGRSVRRRRRPE